VIGDEGGVEHGMRGWRECVGALYGVFVGVYGHGAGVLANAVCGALLVILTLLHMTIGIYSLTLPS
jgi:hypothetical protein